MITIGNFTSVAGQSRIQIALIDLTTAPATVAPWATTGYSGACAGVFDSYMRDVEFSPDGSYFVVGDTGAGYFPSTLCDTVMRWETNAVGLDQQPTWVDYSGGDTMTAVAVTGGAVYAGGHFRWMNNDAVGDVAAGGAVSRDGLAALDPENGCPSPGTPRAIAGSACSTSSPHPRGSGSVTTRAKVANQTHNRIAFFPLAGGTTVPVGVNATLPGTLYNTARAICPREDTSVLYRVNTGGPSISSNDCGPGWVGDTSDPIPTGTTAPTPPARGAWAPASLATSPRAPPGPSSTPNVGARPTAPRCSGTSRSLPEATGRLFLERVRRNSQPGQRVFDVKLDGTTVLSNYDIVADMGSNIGTMKAFNVTSDGNVNIDFSHVVENPLINGIEIVDTDAPPIPTEQYCAGTDASVAYRINTGGPTLKPFDCGPSWGADQSDPSAFRNNGTNTAAWDPVLGVNNSVPSTTPRAMFQTERWSPSDSPAMMWAFPMPAGTNVQVHLYFANGALSTGSAGQRVFNVKLDGTTVLPNYDIAADVGHRTGVMKSFNLTSDGIVNIDFSHVVENPLINGIEIINRDAPAGPQPMPSASFLGQRNFDGTTLGADSTLNTPGTDWSQANGAFTLNGKLYAGWSDGGLYSWTFDGSTLGPKVDVLEQGNYVYGRTWTSFTNVTGMFWHDGRLYYTRDGDAHLFYRYFSPASELLGSVQRVASGPGVDSLDWSNVQGLTAASGKIYYASTDGNLHRVDLADETPVPGTDSVLSGPGIDGRDWRTNAMFTLPQAAPDATPPSTPGKPTGTSISSTSIDLTWAASTDNESASITYNVYRDAGSVAVGQVVSTSTDVVTYKDTGLTPGSVHTYRVDAVDATNNVSPKSAASDPITVAERQPGGLLRLVRHRQLLCLDRQHAPHDRQRPRRAERSQREDEHDEPERVGLQGTAGHAADGLHERQRERHGAQRQRARPAPSALTRQRPVRQGVHLHGGQARDPFGLLRDPERLGCLDALGLAQPGTLWGRRHEQGVEPLPGRRQGGQQLHGRHRPGGHLARADR